MAVGHIGEITNITIGQYKGTDKLEASVMMLVGGQEVRRRWKSPHSSRTATERWAREKAKVFLARTQRKEPTLAPTFAEFATRFVGDHVETAKLRPSTAENLNMNLRTHLLPRLGHLRLDEIGDDHILEIKRLDLAIGTINKILQGLGQILQAAATKGHMKPLKIKRIKAPKTRADFYPPPEYLRLVEAAVNDQRALVAILLGGDAGLRCGEILALGWPRVDWHANKVHVEYSVWRGVVGPTKGGKPRSVDMTPRLRAALLKLQQLGESQPTDDAIGPRVLTRDAGRYADDGEPMSRSALREFVEPAQERASVKRGMHILRHSFCSLLAMAGVPVTAIRDLAGHSSVAITDRYMHLAPKGTGTAIDLLAGLHAR
jgi:integrase